jgi:probable HAF family extracellular repeat protein
MTDLGTLGGADSIARGVNSPGQVVGEADISGSSAFHAFLYSGGTMHDLGTLGGALSQANAINDAGQ